MNFISRFMVFMKSRKGDSIEWSGSSLPPVEMREPELYFALLEKKKKEKESSISTKTAP